LKFPLRVHWLGKSMDARMQIRGISWNILKIENAADGRLPPQCAAGGVSKHAPRYPGCLPDEKSQEIQVNDGGSYPVKLEILNERPDRDRGFGACGNAVVDKVNSIFPLPLVLPARMVGTAKNMFRSHRTAR